MSIWTPPPGAKSIAAILEEARSHLQRTGPSELRKQLQTTEQPIHLVDIRPAAQRAKEGKFYFPPGIPSYHKIHIIERNVLEWRLDPQSPARIKEIVDEFGYETMVVVSCSEGYTSSLAARELQRLGLSKATDLEGGYCAWKKMLESDSTT